MLLFTLSNGQTNFRWEKSNVIAKNKEQIYSDTKKFIDSNWKSSKDVIQFDDKEAGFILVKGTRIIDILDMKEEYVYTYIYNMTFKMRDNYYDFVIDNVYCESAKIAGSKHAVTKIQPFAGDKCPETGTSHNPGISKDKAIPMMASFKQELQSIIDNYESFIKGSGSTKNK